jgi:serpin B
MHLSRRTMLQALLALGASSALRFPISASYVRPSQNELQGFAADTNQFGFDLFGLLRKTPGNVFFSPYSINSCLAMSASGARGTTAEQMTKVLHLPPSTSQYTTLHHGLMGSLLNQPKGYDIRIANALWGQNAHAFSANYVQTAQQKFRAEARTMDFVQQTEACRNTINQWVETQTNQRIKDLLPPGSVRTTTRLILTNAIYFKGSWSKPFDKKLTKREDFHLSANENHKSEMMHLRTRMGYSENETTQLVELPYAGDRLSMVMLLPRTRYTLSNLEANCSAEGLAKLINSRRTEDVILTMPKFKSTFTASLASPLQTLGMRDAFSLGTADFSGVDGTRELFISEVFHKAFCEVNEEGTEAAAATGAVKTLASARPLVPPPPKVFQADHPFLYFIRDVQTGSILFMGRVSDPVKVD